MKSKKVNASMSAKKHATKLTELWRTNAKAILETAGLGLKNVVKTTVFLAVMGDFAAMNEVYLLFFLL